MIYLDNAATSWPKAPGVGDAMVKAIELPVGNVGRSSHEAAMAASMMLYQCRSSAAVFLPPTPLDHLVFVRNATEAVNTALFGTVSGSGAILTTPMEHNAVARPVEVLRKRGSQVHVCRADDWGRVDLGDFSNKLQTLRPILAVFTAASNVTGAINPVEDMVQACINYHIPFVIDAAQAMGEIPKWTFPDGADGAVCFSLHKGLLGPAGVGMLALYGSFRPSPLWYGGTGSLSDSVEQPEFLPDCYESGTPAIHAIAGCKTALDYCFEHRDELNGVREARAKSLFDGLSEYRSLRVVTPPGDRTAVVSATVREGTITSLSEALYEAGIAVRTGFHCAPLAHTHIGSDIRGGVVRFSPGYATTEEDVQEALRVVEEHMYGN